MASPLIIPCPKCGKRLRLRDPRLLGKKAKCPKCENKFLLQAPQPTGDRDEEEVELELVEPPKDTPARGPSFGAEPPAPANSPPNFHAPSTPSVPPSTSPQTAPTAAGGFVQTPQPGGAPPSFAPPPPAAGPPPGAIPSTAPVPPVPPTSPAAPTVPVPPSFAPGGMPAPAVPPPPAFSAQPEAPAPVAPPSFAPQLNAAPPAAPIAGSPPVPPNIDPSSPWYDPGLTPPAGPVMTATSPAVPPHVRPTAGNGANTRSASRRRRKRKNWLGWLGFGASTTTAAAGEGTSRLAELKRRRRRNQQVAIVAGAISALLMGGIALMVGSPEPPRADKDNGEPPRTVQETVEAKNAFRDAAQWAKDSSPTHGPPIELTMMPAGCRIVVNLHPAELWREGSLGHEFRYCLGPLSQWLEQQILQLTKYHPQEIERLQIGLIPGQRGVPPQVAAVVHLVNPFASKSQFLLKLQAQRSDDYGYPVYLTADRVYLIRDNRTFAIAPRLAASELVESMNQSAITSVGVQELLLHSDRNRHVTVVFEPIDIRNFQDVLFPEIMRPFVNRVLDWINEEDVEAVLWSFHLSPDRFYHEVLFRNRNIIREHRLAQVIERKVQQLPHQMLEYVRYMNPPRAGRRQLIGRFPAMLKVAAMASRVGVGSRFVQLVTVLHTDRAAPNLALAALLAWDEATRTDFTKPPTTVASNNTGPQRQPVRERLKKAIDIEFVRTPLQEAFQYIADECNVGLHIEGDALKLAGMTKNMPQTFKLGTAPGWQGIKTIVDRYKNEGMCIVVDEANDRFIVTTVDFAKQKGQQPEPLEKLP